MYRNRAGDKNKLPKHGAFSDAEKVTAKTPHQPRISPQLHHVFTTVKHVKIAKYP